MKKVFPDSKLRLKSRCKAAVVGVVIGFLSLGSVQAQPPESPEWWPCIQRYVPKLAVGTFWQGGLEKDDGWRENKEIVKLAKRLGSRDVPVEESLDEVKAFIAASGGQDAVEDLLRAMESVSNEERNRIVDGIKRFAKRQNLMINRIDQQTQDLETKELTAEQKKDLEARQKWDIRVFEERERMVTYLCEQPVALEKKFFAVGRAIAQAQNKR